MVVGIIIAMSHYFIDTIKVISKILILRKIHPFFIDQHTHCCAFIAAFNSDLFGHTIDFKKEINWQVDYRMYL